MNTASTRALALACLFTTACANGWGALLPEDVDLWRVKDVPSQPSVSVSQDDDDQPREHRWSGSFGILPEATWGTVRSPHAIAGGLGLRVPADVTYSFADGWAAGLTIGNGLQFLDGGTVYTAYAGPELVYQFAPRLALRGAVTAIAELVNGGDTVTSGGVVGGQLLAGLDYRLTRTLTNEWVLRVLGSAEQTGRLSPATMGDPATFAAASVRQVSFGFYFVHRH